MTIIIDLGSSAVKAGFALEDGRYGDLNLFFTRSVVRSFGRSVARSFSRLFVIFLVLIVVFN